MNRSLVWVVIATMALAACSGQNRNEREADKITRGVIANNMVGVSGDFDPTIKGEITRVRVAELSDELNDQGQYQGLKQDDSWCRTGYVCFDVKFAKRPYYEMMKVGSDGKVQYWWIQNSHPQR